MATSILSSITGSISTTGLGTGSAGSVGLSSTVPTDSLVPSVSSDVSSVISATVTPILSATGTTSLTQSTAATPTSALISTSSSPTSIPTTSVISLISSLNTPTTSTSAPSTSNSVSPTESLNLITAVTAVGGASTTFTSLLPTTLVDSPSADAVSRRTAAIAGATTGSIALVLIILAAIFLYRRHKLRKTLESSGKKREGRSLLDGEEFDDDDRNISTSMQSYPYATHAIHPEANSTLNLMKSRTSDTGSIFREEVWPPPGFIDPISKQSSQVDLSGIVDEVMGSSSFGPVGPSAGPHRSRQPTDTSTLSAISSTSTSSLITDKLYSSEPSRSTLESRTPTSPSSMRSPPPSPSARPSPKTQPRKSSPLARTSISDPKLWLTRNIRPTATP